MSTRVVDKANEEWVAELRARAAPALSDLRDYLCRSLQKVLQGRAGQSDVEDFAQQALTRILESLDRFRGDSRFTTWASAIAIRISLSELRRKRWGDASLDELMERGVPLDSAVQSAPAGHVAHNEMLAVLKDAIDAALTERQRAAILGEMHGMPTAVLCKELDTNPGALYKLHHDARKRLRGYLEKRGITAADVQYAVDGASNLR